VYTVLVENLKGYHHLGNLITDGEDNIKVDLVKLWTGVSCLVLGLSWWQCWSFRFCYNRESLDQL